jgi:hypothetical protein
MKSIEERHLNEIKELRDRHEAEYMCELSKINLLGMFEIMNLPHSKVVEVVFLSKYNLAVPIRTMVVSDILRHIPLSVDGTWIKGEGKNECRYGILKK